VAIQLLRSELSPLFEASINPLAALKVGSSKGLCGFVNLFGIHYQICTFQQLRYVARLLPKEDHSIVLCFA
jgi:hypothetical protein